MPAVMSDLLLKIAFASIWMLARRFFSKEAMDQVMALSHALMDVDLPGATKLGLLREFALSLLGEISNVASAGLTIALSAMFGMVQANGKSWIERQIGGPVDTDQALAQIEALIEKRQ